jgi:hypothetical protein
MVELLSYLLTYLLGIASGVWLCVIIIKKDLLNTGRDDFDNYNFR